VNYPFKAEHYFWFMCPTGNGSSFQAQIIEGYNVPERFQM